MNNSEKLGLVGLVIGVAAAGYTVYQSKKMERIYALVDDGVNKMADNIEVDVTSAMVEEAVHRAVDKEVNKAVRSVSMEITSKVRSDLQREVRDVISTSFSDIKDSVSVEVRKQVANINITELRRDIKEEAKEKIVKKFDGDLDELLEKYNQNLSNVSKIYNSIADNITKKNETVLKIGG